MIRDTTNTASPSNASTLVRRMSVNMLRGYAKLSLLIGRAGPRIMPVLRHPLIGMRGRRRRFREDPVASLRA